MERKNSRRDNFPRLQNPMYYFYRRNQFVRSFSNQRDAIAYAETEMRQWLEQGMPCPPLKVCWNGSGPCDLWTSEAGEIPFAA